tara:strand:+ start:264 stop:500 length:237 start_codon:yes stop_codon:yes gene_type:complete
MKRLLLPLLAALALPTAVNAESYWLVLLSGGARGKALDKIEMASMENCIYQGEIFLNGLSGAKKIKDDDIFYVCLTGK